MFYQNVSDATKICYSKIKLTISIRIWKAKPRNLQTLAVILIAKKLDMVSLHDSDGPWVFHGIITRMAFAEGFHRDPSGFNGMPVYDQEIRRRIWTTIVFLEMGSALDTGMPLQIRPSDIDCLPPSNINDSDVSKSRSEPLQIKPLTELTESTFQIHIMKVAAFVLEIIGQANSPNACLPYDEVLKVDRQIRHFMEQANEEYKNASEAQDYAFPQKTFLDMMYRRLLLVIHRPYMIQENAKENHPLSYYTCLDCASNMMMARLNLTDRSLPEPKKAEWISELLKEEFLYSNLLLIMEMFRQKKAKDDTGLMRQPVEHVVETLKRIREIVSHHVCISVHHYKEHMAYGLLLGMIEAGDDPDEVWASVGKSTFETLTWTKEMISKGLVVDKATPPDDTSTDWSVPTTFNPEAIDIDAMESELTNVSIPLNFLLFFLSISASNF